MILALSIRLALWRYCTATRFDPRFPPRAHFPTWHPPASLSSGARIFGQLASDEILAANALAHNNVTLPRVRDVVDTTEFGIAKFDPSSNKEIIPWLICRPNDAAKASEDDIGTDMPNFLNALVEYDFQDKPKDKQKKAVAIILGGTVDATVVDDATNPERYLSWDYLKRKGHQTCPNITAHPKQKITTVAVEMSLQVKLIIYGLTQPEPGGAMVFPFVEVCAISVIQRHAADVKTYGLEDKVFWCHLRYIAGVSS